MSATRSGLPPSARRLIATVACGGAVIAAVRVPEAFRWSGNDVIAWATLALAIAVLEQFWIEIPHGEERENFSLTDAPFAASLLLVRPSVLTLAIAAGAIAGQSARRIAPLKIAFNVGQFLIGMTAAEAVFAALHGGSRSGVGAWLSAIAGMGVYFLLNVGIVALVIALVQGEPFERVLLSSVGLSVLHWAGNVALGILAAVVFQTHPQALPLLGIPLGLSYLAYRSWIRSEQERSRMDEMAAAAASIAAGGALTGRIPPVAGDERVASLATTLNRML